MLHVLAASFHGKYVVVQKPPSPRILVLKPHFTSV